MITVLITLLLFNSNIKTGYCQENKYEIENVFKSINKVTEIFNHVAAEIAWESSVNPDDPGLPDRAAKFQKKRLLVQQLSCDKMAKWNIELLNYTQKRQMYLFCRGPKFTFDEIRKTSALYDELQSTYSEAKICIELNNLNATVNITSKSNVKNIEAAILNFIVTPYRVFGFKIDEYFKWLIKNNINENENSLCLNGEDEVQNFMKFSRNELVLKFFWLSWREKIGPSIREPYKQLVKIENIAARRRGYTDIGASWRDELEIPNLRQVCRDLYEEIKPLYAMLHGIARFYLRKHYGDIVPEYGVIPAHLLGDLWSQNWEAISDLIIPQTIDLDNSIKTLNWSVNHMLKRAEDFYMSMGLPPMTETFWEKSVFKRNGKVRCHGTAADMFKDGDFRLLYCSGTTAEDFYVIHHEMGHIHYYMAYQDQPGIFRQANSALQETVGDAIMYGVMTPQNLHRLGLINDSILYSQTDLDDKNDVDDDGVMFGEDDIGIDDMSPSTILLLKQALNKLPQIPFALLMDEYRWKYFEGAIDEGALNEEFWDMVKELQGIGPVGLRGEKYFDVAAKFHVPDNTPYIRYYLSSFLQHQLFESLCKAAVFGRRRVAEDLPPSIMMSRCDIYGSKAAGKLLRDFMSRGHSQHWREILSSTTGFENISASSLKRYYRPLFKHLEKLVRKRRIPIGW